MDDYAIKIDKLPHIDTYAGDRDILKAILWNHFYNLFEKEIELEQDAAGKKDNDEENEGGAKEQTGGSPNMTKKSKTSLDPKSTFHR